MASSLSTISAQHCLHGYGLEYVRAINQRTFIITIIRKQSTSEQLLNPISIAQLH